MWQKIKPSATVVAVFVAGALGLWVVIALRLIYDVHLDARDVAMNLVWFMTLAGWWTDRLSNGKDT